MTAQVGIDGLAELSRALDVDSMRPLLARAAGLHADEISTCSARILSYKPGERCTIRYGLSQPRESRGDSPEIGMVGKLYRAKADATRVYEWSNFLRTRTPMFDGSVGVPAPRALDDDLALVLHDEVPGADLRHPLASGVGDAPLVLAAHWLVDLHGMATPRGVSVKSLEHELEKLDGWSREIEDLGELTARERKRLAKTRSGAARLAAGLGQQPNALIHRDFYYANVLWDDATLWILDYDRLSLGAPALDVGHFLAHLENLSLRTAGTPDRYRREQGVFLGAYLENGSHDVASSLSFYRAYTFLKLAATRARRRQNRWRELTRALADLAYREVGSNGGR